MLGLNQHADKVYALAQEKSGAASSPIAASWRRCLTKHGLAPEESRQPVRLTDAEFRETLAHSGHVVEEASSELDWLFGMVGKAGCCLVFTDSAGVVLERRGVSSEDKEFRDLGLWTGTLWSEASVGTNGIGTALADGRMVTVFREQHFLSANIGLSCASAPVRDHKGQIVAAIDISTARRDATEMIMPVLAQAAKDTASRIEINLFKRAYSGSRIVLVNGASHSGSALLAVDRDDMVTGATRAARLALKIDDMMIAHGIPASDLLQESQEREGSDLLEAERAALRRALSRNNGNVSLTAQMLGISRATLHRKINKLDLHA
ncbi:sigma-54-dependent Fis family transcriptional regulator [Rhizobium sp. KVB221]|uniref:Sigma-54-dependent Fis family transcriptional regulator n=1 Tax=Rhizobium setariae TaxID=2801340 RepID=A0A936YLY4_9HYPH|nr:helix-turn-helix domain-containing protein [Rhizobium setariae]MBL0371973.1 sigma-54-dependent Fis family transcriptional regulator [Rhizobium setariae]